MTDTPLSPEPLSPKPLSPCVDICVIHPDARICTVCYRTRDEIAVWGGLSNAERRDIMDGLAARASLLNKHRGGRAGKLARRAGGD